MKYTLSGPPIPLARPRLSKGRVYNPQEKEMNAAEWELKFQAPKEYLEGPISLDVTFYMPMATTMSKRKKDHLIDQPHASRPDIDNLLKFLLDAAKCLYKDDSQVSTVIARKIYSDNPRTEFTIEAL
jgi:Holliday junction resolvase RusA-like endonuclease